MSVFSLFEVLASLLLIGGVVHSYKTRKLTGQDKVDSLVFENGLYKFAIVLEVLIIATGYLYGSDSSFAANYFIIAGSLFIIFYNMYEMNLNSQFYY